MDNGTNRATFDGIIYNPPLVPAMFSELTENATVISAYGPLSFVAEDGEISRFGRQTRGPQNVLSRCRRTHSPAWTQRIVGRSDTFPESATLRVVADCPGVWLFHCTLASLLSISENSVMQVISNGISNPASRCSSLKRFSRLKPPQNRPSPWPGLPLCSAEQALQRERRMTDLSDLKLDP
jgi:iron transport multicopper oxidase